MDISIGKFRFSTTPRDRKMFTGGGSGLYEPTQLSEAQRSRPIVLQDTRRSVDQITWRRLLSYARQLHANCGEVRGPVVERAILANSGGWLPRHTGLKTEKKVRRQYEEWLWNWMKVCDVRGQPYDFWNAMYLASVSIDRDGEAIFIPTVNRNGDPRLQWIANHRLYSHWNSFTVTDPGPYNGMKFNNGVVYDDQSAPVAYYVLEESLMFAQAIKGQYIPAKSMSVMYNPDWFDQGRGVTAYAHGIRRIFDSDDIHGYLLIGIKRDAALPIIRRSLTGRVDPGQEHISDALSPNGQPIKVREEQGGGMWDVTVDSKSDIIIPSSDRPSPNVPEYLETILIGVYQGLGWPYEFTRLSKEARGANIRVTVEKINHAVRKQYSILHKIAVRACGYALGAAVKRGELPPGEWWAWEFPTPPEMTADKWREYQEDRENYKLGMTSLQDLCARRGIHWRDDLREQRDEDMDDMITRCKNLQKKHPELSLQQIIDLYQQRSANPSAQPAGQEDEEETESGAQDTGAKPNKD